MANIIIIGGGVAGLSAGIEAQLRGHSATIYEKHFKAGGNLTAWDRSGYHIDNCIHWLTGTNRKTSLYKLWEKVGALGNVDVHQAKQLLAFEKDGERISLSDDIEKIKADMLSISPEDKKEILSFVKAVKAIHYIQGIGGKNHDESSLVKLIVNAPALIKYLALSTGELAARFKSPTLRGFFECFMTDVFASLALIIVVATFTSHNGGIPVGSSSAMADRMVEKFESLGGKICLKNGVTRANVEGDRVVSVTLEDGTEAFGDYFVVTYDPASVFGGILDKKYMPAALKSQYADPRMRRFSSYHTAFACDVQSAPFEDEVVFEIPEKYRVNLRAKYIMVREFSREPSFSPNGKTLIQTMTYLMEEDSHYFVELRKDKEAYKGKKASIAADIAEIITEKYPELKGRIECLDVWTPASYNRYVGSEMGSYMSFILPAKQAQKKVSSKIKGLKNALLATQWQNSPGGLPYAAMAGVGAIKRIPKRKKARV